VVKANLFFVSGLVWRTAGSFELDRVGGLFRSKWWLALLFFVPAFSLAGFPPLSGFWAKMVLIRASLELGDYVVAFVAAFVGLMTVYSMTKIWDKAFWTPARRGRGSRPDAREKPVSKWMIVPVAVMALVTIGIGLLAGPFMDFSLSVAKELMEPSGYVQAVLGTGR
jgi:multicomponent Na+:H+ antiporter subunit D